MGAAPDDGRLEDEVKNLIEYKNCSGKKLIGKQFTACAFSNNSIHIELTLLSKDTEMF